MDVSLSCLDEAWHYLATANKIRHGISEWFLTRFWVSEHRVVLTKITCEIFVVLLLISLKHILTFSATSDEHTKPSSNSVHYQQAEQCSTRSKSPKHPRRSSTYSAKCSLVYFVCCWYCYWRVSPMGDMGHFWDSIVPYLKVTFRDRK
jgi:hypothetical protein